MRAEFLQGQVLLIPEGEPDIAYFDARLGVKAGGQVQALAKLVTVQGKPGTQPYLALSIQKLPEPKPEEPTPPPVGQA